MQSYNFSHYSGASASQLISSNQKSSRHQTRTSELRKAIKKWESTIPGKAQENISQAVAKEWIDRGGTGLLLAGSVYNTKQNFFRMVNNPGPKNDKNLERLRQIIADLMPIEIARQYGIKQGMTESELVASAVKECSEAHQAKLLGVPITHLEKEVREGMESLLKLMPAECWGTVIASLSSMLPQCM
ncbi:toxin YdaT family protein [Mangrovibacter sp. SLW1]